MSAASAPPLPMDTIHHLLFAPYPAFALMAACQLDVFTPLNNGALTAQELADKLDVGVSKLGPLLYALVAAKLLIVADERFSNTKESGYYLVKGQPTYAGKRLDVAAAAWSATMKTAASIRAGVGLAHDDFDYTRLSPEKLEVLLRGFHAPALAIGRMLAERFDFATRRSLIDVGGGSGGTAIALLEIFPHLHGTIVEQRNVAPVTNSIVAESSAANRIRVIAADATRESLDGGFDCAILGAVIQTMSAEEARRLLQNVGNALTRGGALFIIGAVLDDSRLTPAAIATLNLLLINSYAHGQAYTEGEYVAWLTEAGFEEIRREILPDWRSLISARKAL